MASKVKLFVENVSSFNSFALEILLPYFDEIKVLPNNNEDDIVFYIDYHPSLDIKSSIEKLSTDTLGFIRKNKSKIFILTEGFDMFGNIPEIFEQNNNVESIAYWKILSELASHGIAEEQLYIISSNYGYDAEIKQLASREVKWLGKTYDVKAKFLYFNEYLSLYTKENNKVKDIDKIKFLFSSLANGRPAIHRYKFTKKLYNNGLHEHGKISMVKMDGPDLEFNKLLPIVFDESHNLWIERKDEEYLFEDTSIWISNETFLNQPNIKGYTEKTIKPIYYKSPFMINGCKGLLELLRQDGFQTFNSVWDESYDQMSDIDDRQDHIIKVLKSLEAKTPRQLYEETLPIVTHNYNHLMSIDAGEKINKFFTG